MATMAAALAGVGTAAAGAQGVGLGIAPARVGIGTVASAMSMTAFESSALIAFPGGVRALTLATDGSIRLGTGIALGAGVNPSAVAEYVSSDEVEALVLDRAGDRVLVLRGDKRRGFSVAQSVATGRDPIALAVTRWDGDGGRDVAIANAGSDTVTVLHGETDGTLGAARAFAVGGRPVDVVAADFDNDQHDDLAVARNAGAGLTVLSGDGEGNVRLRRDIALPGHPIDVVAFEGEDSFAPNDLDNDQLSDVAVAYADTPVVSVLLGSQRAGLRTAGAVSPPGPGRSVALTTASLGTRRFQDAALARADPPSLTLLISDARGHLTPQSPLALAAPPVALAAVFGPGDSRQDLLVADAAAGIEAIVPGARLLRSTPRDRPAVSLQAQRGSLFYSQRTGRTWREYRVSGAAGATPVALKIPPAASSIAVSPGVDGAGRPELAYARCGAPRRCAPYVFGLPQGPERRVRIARPAGCQVVDFARWRALVAYQLASRSSGSCPASRRGMWVRRGRGPARRLARRPFVIDVVRGRQVLYTDLVRSSGDVTARLRLWSPGREPVTVERLSNGECDVEIALGAVYDDGYLYWNWECGSSIGGPASALVRARVNRPRCASEVRDWAAPNDDPDLAVDSGRVFYADAGGLFALPDRPRWPTPRCARR